MRVRMTAGILLVLCLLVTGADLVEAAAARDPFEGTKWKVTVTPEQSTPGSRAFDDELTFKGSQFSSKHFAAKGFKPVSYEEDTRGIQTGAFAATLKSDAEGMVKWRGNVTVNEMAGEMTWTKSDGSEVSYTFKGSKIG